MRLHRVLAATLAAFFVVGCSSEKSTSPKVQASTGPKEKPSVEPSREAVNPAPPPKADPAPATTGSPPAQHEDPAKERNGRATASARPERERPRRVGVLPRAGRGTAGTGRQGRTPQSVRSKAP